MLNTLQRVLQTSWFFFNSLGGAAAAIGNSGKGFSLAAERGVEGGEILPLLVMLICNSFISAATSVYLECNGSKKPCRNMSTSTEFWSSGIVGSLTASSTAAITGYLSSTSSYPFFANKITSLILSSGTGLFTGTLASIGSSKLYDRYVQYRQTANAINTNSTDVEKLPLLTTARTPAAAAPALQ